MSYRRLAPPALAAVCLATPAAAHVKWFAPFIVGAPPQPLSTVLLDVWFWSGIALVMVFFVTTRLVERTSLGQAVQRDLDRLTFPLWRRIDDYIRATVGAFFVAIFAVGGVYLTPDLKTPAEWVSWLQLVIAAAIFSRRTMPLAGIGIIALWLLAARDYDLFHLLDYLALGFGIAAYLILEPSREDWRAHRFEALRWGLAVALMWSSLEKFAYPEWFYPLVVEKPFLTFGLPRDVFIPMAGVAEFTMGFGLLWTPLVRRLSAMALLVIFTAAVWPFGRVDLIGHGLIMAILVAVACEHGRNSRLLHGFTLRTLSIPVGIALALVIFIGAYWGLHRAIYGAEGITGTPPGPLDTHSYDPDHPHGAPPAGGATSP